MNNLLPYKNTYALFLSWLISAKLFSLFRKHFVWDVKKLCLDRPNWLLSFYFQLEEMAGSLTSLSLASPNEYPYSNLSSHHPSFFTSRRLFLLHSSSGLNWLFYGIDANSIRYLSSLCRLVPFFSPQTPLSLGPIILCTASRPWSHRRHLWATYRATQTTAVIWIGNGSLIGIVYTFFNATTFRRRQPLLANILNLNLLTNKTVIMRH